jgi:molybdopterin-guanine dinucleotide biosynthesis protein A
MAIAVEDITGLVLAGGRGSRMGGVDKGLQLFQGIPLARHALVRLAPQVGRLMINANRSVEEYRAMDVPVWSDELPDFPGPLAGMLAGLTHCETPYLLTVPCDSPFFPADLACRLSAGLLENGTEIATAYTPEGTSWFPQPVFCLMKATLQASLLAFIQRGERKTGLWSRELRGARVRFQDIDAFANFNTVAELEHAQKPRS